MSRILTVVVEGVSESQVQPVGILTAEERRFPGIDLPWRFRSCLEHLWHQDCLEFPKAAVIAQRQAVGPVGARLAVPKKLASQLA